MSSENSCQTGGSPHLALLLPSLTSPPPLRGKSLALRVVDIRGLPLKKPKAPGKKRNKGLAVLLSKLLTIEEVHDRLLLNKNQVVFVSLHYRGEKYPFQDNYGTTGKLYKYPVEDCPDQCDPKKIPTNNYSCPS